MDEFRDLMAEAGQEAVDEAVESYADALGMADSYGDAAQALLAAYGKRTGAAIARVVDEARYAAGGIGGSHA